MFIYCYFFGAVYFVFKASDIKKSSSGVKAT